MVRHALDRLVHLLDVDRRENQGRGRYEVRWPVVVPVPLTPMEYDALRFLSSLYPASMEEVLRASVLPYLDPGSAAPIRLDDGLDHERTARAQLRMHHEEAGRLDDLSRGEGVDKGTMARWAMWGTLGPLLETPRP